MIKLGMGSKSESRWIVAPVRVALLLFIAVTFLPIISAASIEQSSAMTQEMAVQSLHEWIDLLEELRTHVDKSQFESEKILDSSDYEAEVLINFVRNRIVFQQYAGVMKGAAGTLMTGAGNALDQSLLLASLLKDAGYDAKILHGQLSNELANSLITQMTTIQPVFFKPFTNHAEAVLLRMSEFSERHKSFIKPENNHEKIFDERRERQYATQLESEIIEHLKTKQIKLEARNIPDSLVEEARNYYWVQYRSAAAEDWQHIHPAFKSRTEALNTLKHLTSYKDKLPDTVQQRIRIQAFIQRRLGEQVESIPITDPWERPVANLINVPLSYKNASNSQIRVALGGSKEPNALFIPMIGESIAPGAQAFDINGNVVPIDAALSNMGALFATMSDKGNEAASALSAIGSNGGDSNSQIMALEDVWLEITLIIPGIEKEKSWGRSFRSGFGEEPPTIQSLSERVTINLDFGRLIPAAAYDALLELQIETLKLALMQNMSTDSSIAPNKQATTEPRIDYSIFDRGILFTSILQLAKPELEGGVSYHPEPLIFASHEPLLASEQAVAGLDIINSTRRSFVRDSTGKPYLQPITNLGWGVWEAISESVAIQSLYDSPISAASASATIVDGKEPIVLIAQSTNVNLQRMIPSMQEAIKQAVADGNVAIVPSPDPSDAFSRGWWKINPESGETIGVTENGWGGSYFFTFGVEISENIVQRKVAAALSCMVVANAGCRSVAKMVRAEAQIIGAFGLDQLCDAVIAYLSGGGSLPPGIPGCSDVAEVPLDMLFDNIEKAAYEKCFKRSIQECAKNSIR